MRDYAGRQQEDEMKAKKNGSCCFLFIRFEFRSLVPPACMLTDANVPIRFDMKPCGRRVVAPRSSAPSPVPGIDLRLLSRSDAASVAVAEALYAGNVTAPPIAGVADLAVAGLAVAIAALAVAASFVLVSFDAHAHAHAGQGRLRRILDLGPSLCGPRLLLAFFVGLLAAAEMLRLPFFRGAAMLPPRRHVMPCLAYPLVAHGIAEPGLLASVLLLLRASVGGARLPAAALAVPLACLPFLTAHVLVLATPATVAAYPGQLAHAADGAGHCAYPAYAATLLLALVAVYLPLLATACWDVAAVAINRRLRARAYALSVLILVPLPLQVLALALTSVWDMHQYTSPTVGLVGFVAVAVAAEATLVILVMLPVHDALVLVQHLPAATAGQEAPDDR